MERLRAELDCHGKGIRAIQSRLSKFDYLDYLPIHLLTATFQATYEREEPSRSFKQMVDESEIPNVAKH